MGADQEIFGLPLDSAGMRLRRAREASARTLADVASATKVPERLLAALEAGNYAALPPRIYVIGFARSYARLVGLDEEMIAREVRSEIDGAPAPEPAPAPAFVPGDPARVPERRVAVMAGIGALVVVVAGALFWHTSYNPAGTLPSILPAETPLPPNSRAAAPKIAPTAAPAPGGAVALSALAPGIWVKVYEASGKTLLEKQLAQGESFTVPADAKDPLIWTGRPDALALTVGGKPVAKLSDTQKTMKGVPISAAALLARPAAAAKPAGSAAKASTASL